MAKKMVPKIMMGGGHDENVVDEKHEGEVKDPEAEVQEPEGPEKGSQEEEKSGNEDFDQEQDMEKDSESDTEKDPEPEKENGSSDGESGENSDVGKEPGEDEQKESDDPSADEKEDPDQNEQQVADTNTSEAKEEEDSEIAADHSTEENDEEEKAALKKLAEMISALPDVSEIEDKTEEELHQIQDQLDNIALYMEDHELEPDEEQQEILNTVADSINQRMIQTLEAAVLEGECGATASDEVRWALTFNEDGEDTYTLTISGTGAMKNHNDSTDLVSGSAVDGSYPWASYSSNITEIVIEDGVTSIGAKAFIAYTNVKKVSIGKDVQEIGTGAFNQLVSCSEFDFPSGSEFFVVDEQGALYNADMTKLYALPCQSGVTNYVLPDSVEVIGYNAFARCADLETVTISSRSCLKTVGFGSFALTPKLTTVKTFPKTVTTVGTLLFSNSHAINLYCEDKDVITLLTSDSKILSKEDIRILTEDEDMAEEYKDSEGHTWLLNYPESGQACFKTVNFEATTVVIPDEIKVGEKSYSVTEIGGGAFAVTTDYTIAYQQKKINTALSSVEIPYSVRKIGEKAFYWCVNLKNITIESSSITIGTAAFNTFATNDYSDDPTTPTTIDISKVKNLTDTYVGSDFGNGRGVNFIIGDEVMLNTLIHCENGTRADLTGKHFYWIRKNNTWVKVYDTQTAIDDIEDQNINWEYGIDDKENIILINYNKKNENDKTDVNITVPEYLMVDGEKYNVVKLGTALFGTTESAADGVPSSHNQKIESVVIPDTVTETDADLFRYSTNLKKISFKASQLKLNGTRTFSGCTSLKVIDLSSVQKLDQSEKWDNTFTSVGNVTVYTSSSDIAEFIASKSDESSTITCLVTNGGTIDITETTDAKTGLYTPAKADYIFGGWYDNSACTGNPITVAESGKTYYAKWKKSFAPKAYEIDTSEITLGPLKAGYTDKDRDGNIGYKKITYDGDGKNFDARVTCDSDQFDVTVYAYSSNSDYKIEIAARRGLDVGIHSANIKVVTGDGQKFQFKVSIEITKADSVITAGEGGDSIKATYGDTVALTAKVRKQESNSRIRTFSQPVEDSVDFYCGDELLGTAMVKYDDRDPMSGTAKLNYDTGKKGIPAGSPQKITAYYGGSGQLNTVSADIIQVMLEKLDTSIFLTADKSEMTGSGSVELNVDAALLPYAADYTISCDDAAIKVLEKDADVYEAQLPDADKVYTFTAKYAGDGFHNEVEDSVTVTVKKTAAPDPSPAPVPVPTPDPTPTPSHSESSDSDGTIGLDDTSSAKKYTQTNTAASDGVTAGTWSLKADGKWDFRKTDGSIPSNEWLRCIWNGKPEWYRFDENGDLKAGWFTDADGSVYYMHDIHDGNFGAMYTGWHKIQDKWYYFFPEEKSGKKQGALLRNGQTPDGYYVDAAGVWDGKNK